MRLDALKERIKRPWLIILFLGIIAGSLLITASSSFFIGQSSVQDVVAASLPFRLELAPFILGGATYYSCDYQGLGGTIGSDTGDYLQYGGYLWGASGNFIVCYSASIDPNTLQIQRVWTYEFCTNGLETSTLPQMSEYHSYSFISFIAFYIVLALIISTFILIGVGSYLNNKKKVLKTCKKALFSHNSMEKRHAKKRLHIEHHFFLQTIHLFDA
jgi:hypothetical protein